MTLPFRLVSLLVLLVIWLSASSAFAQQKANKLARAHEDISMDLVSNDRAVMASALEEYLNISEEQRTHRLKVALVDALAIENERRRRYYLEERPYRTFDSDDTIGLRLFKEVRRMRDLAYIDLLLPWLCCGGEPAWIEFGIDVFDHVLNFVFYNEFMEDHALHGGVLVLTMMVDHWGLDSFNPDQREKLRKIADKYIKINDLYDPWYLFLPATELASAIGDNELIEMANFIVHDDNELRKRPHTDIWGVEYLQKTVLEAVSGTRKPYSHEPYEQYLQEREALDISD